MIVGLAVLALPLVRRLVHRRRRHRAPARRPATRNLIDRGVPDVNQLGESLFTTYLFAFEVTSVLLVIAVVGAVVLARKVKRAELIDDPLVEAHEAERRRRQPSDDAEADDRAPSRARGGDVVIAVAEVTPAWYLVLGSILFSIGAVGLLVRRNPLVMFMCVELMLNAVTLTFVTFSRMLDDIDGQTVVVFVLVVAAAEVVVGLGIIVALLRKQPDGHRRRHQRAEGMSARGDPRPRLADPRAPAGRLPRAARRSGAGSASRPPGGSPPSRAAAPSSPPSWCSARCSARTSTTAATSTTSSTGSTSAAST